MKSIVLRRLKVSDCTTEYFEWMLDEYNRSVISTLVNIDTFDDLLESTISRILDPSCSLIGIFNNNEHIGNMQARIIGPSSCILSILIGRKEHRGRGVGLKSLSIFLKSRDLWPCVYNNITFYASIKVSNYASIRLFESAGFRLRITPEWPQSLSTLEKEEDCVLYEYTFH